MAKRKAFTKIDHDNNARIDMMIDIDAGKVVHWCINVALIMEDGKSYDVYRADTCHGFLHEQRFWQGRRKIALDGDYTEMFKAKKNEVLESYPRWVLLFKKRRGMI